ncbi:Hyphally regulated cell wall protein N-terminal-domain-containing protein [Scheffersomyces xylosifermentans]|uniref:Hyphally regulated cell wall protein N-terminal-domain-containing protein n=1 Tax=Scheffersomyces xylosifermentans TaxID=1304137 RepID=UPI00315CCD1A
MLFRKHLIASLLSVVTVWAATITEDTIDRGTLNLGIGDTTIADGVYWSIVDNALTALAGSGFYISSTSNLIALTVTLASGIGSITNDGIIAFNSVQSLTAPTYQLMYLGGNVWSNTGLLVFYQQTRSNGVVTLGAPLTTISNPGTICLYNEIYQSTTSISGSGCIVADQNSAIFLANGLLSVSSSQTLYLADSASSIRVNAVALPQTFTVAGYGNGNIIGLDIPIFATLGPAWSYSSSTGILTLNGAGLLSQKFNIGTGYINSNFKIVTDPGVGLTSVGLGALQYNGPIPAGANKPTNCLTCKTLPPAPGTSATASTSTFATTNPDGSVCTEFEQILISTDAANSWYTSSSIVSSICSTQSNSQTTITSIWTGSETTTVTVTDTVGGTDTVIVEVPSNSQTTLTSVWTGTTTQTITQTDTLGGTDTVIVEVPSNPQTTVTSVWTGSETTTITFTDTQGGTDTVVVEVPSNSQTTETSTWTGTTTRTITETDTLGGTDTVIVEVPSTANTQTTITSVWTGTETITSNHHHFCSDRN